MQKSSNIAKKCTISDIKPDILWTTIFNKLVNSGIHAYSIDIRYLSKWIKTMPHCFPVYMHKNEYNINFNTELLRYEIYKKK